MGANSSTDRGGFPVRREQCDSCIYRKRHAKTGARLAWDVPELEAQIQDEHGFFQGHRVCHAPAIEDGEELSGPEVCCRGYWNRHRDDFPLGQIAQRLGRVIEV